MRKPPKVLSFLSASSVKSLVHSLIISHLDYCLPFFFPSSIIAVTPPRVYSEFRCQNYLLVSPHRSCGASLHVSPLATKAFPYSALSSFLQLQGLAATPYLSNISLYCLKVSFSLKKRHLSPCLPLMHGTASRNMHTMAPPFPL